MESLKHIKDHPEVHRGKTLVRSLPCKFLPLFPFPIEFQKNRTYREKGGRILTYVKILVIIMIANIYCVPALYIENIYLSACPQGFPGGSEGKASAYNVGDPLEKGMATHSSTLAWKIPWTEKPGRLESMGSQRVGHG